MEGRCRVSEELRDFQARQRDWTTKELEEELFKRLVVDNQFDEIIEIDEEIKDGLVALTNLWSNGRDTHDMASRIAANIKHQAYQYIINNQ